MDEALDVVEVVVDSELDGAFVWLLRALGLFAVIVGLGLIAAPQVLLFLAEFA